MSDSFDAPVTLATLHDAVCFEYGDIDAIQYHDSASICHFELQQSSQSLAAQLLFRYRPTLVLLDLKGHVAAEAVSMLACSRIGVMFVPVNVQDKRRLEDMVSTLTKHLGEEDARIVAVLRCDDDSDPMVSTLESVGIFNMIYLNHVGDLLEPMDVPSSLSSDDLPETDNLYVLFTSGSTSTTPKAVVGSQSSTMHRLKWFQSEFSSTKIIARRSKLTFVDGITEILSALLFPPSILYAFDPGHLVEHGLGYILDSPCTQVTMLPSQLEQLLLLVSGSSKTKRNLSSSLERVIVSGEVCKASLLPTFQQAFPNTQLLNLYGQTESTGDILYAVLTDMEHPIVNNVVTIGKPIPGVVVSNCPDTKELIVRGNLANGYLGGDVERFDEFHTGDVGFVQNGNWYVEGRIGDMVKIHGHFASPALIETAFQHVYSGVPCAAVIMDSVVYVMVEKTNGWEFSRQAMRDAGIAWHLIPRQVFEVSRIPAQTGGAGKVNRIEVNRIVQEFLSMKLPTDAQSTGENVDEFASVLSSVLGIAVAADNESSSFVELGGDSALAVTLLYKLRVSGLLSRNLDVTAADIMECDTMQELRGIVSGEATPKRRRLASPSGESSFEPFVACPVIRLSDNHVAFDFRACVDSSPLFHGSVIYGACQGGVIHRIENEEVVSCHDLPGWKIQAGMIIIDDFLIACGYKSDGTDRGIAVALPLDLSSAKARTWSVEMHGQIKSTPIHVKSQVWILAGKELVMLDVSNGSQVSTIHLPSKSESKPVVLGTPGSQVVVYAFSDWDTGLALVDKNGEMTRVFVDNLTSPVYANLLAVDSNRLVVCDISGYMHDVNIETMELTSTKIANKPIFSSPILACNDSIVIGSHDGMVRCVKASNFKVTLWQLNAGAVVYSSPLAMPDGCCIVCTTAGDVILVNGGVEIWRTKVPGEVWSDPVMVGKDVVAVGARDSRVHMIKIVK